jgi:ribosomal protein S18 acetylase RimI-like enzyme
MWLPPGISSRYSMGLRQVGLLLSMFRYGGLAGLRRGQILDEVVSPEHMKAPHYYLHAIGAHLDFQGRGIGSALLKSGVSICDENKMPAYLESSNERNNPLYERYGFEITKELQLPKNGPKLWLMERSAAI